MANHLLLRTCQTALRISAAASVTMLLASVAHRRTPWAGINAMTNVVRLGRRSRMSFETRQTLLGLGALVGGLTAMSAVYEAALRRAPGRRGTITGTLFAATGYAIDRFLMPKELLRDFERGMGPVGTFAKYAALGIAAASPQR